MKIFNDKKIIPLKNPNIDIKNSEELINLIKDVPILNLKGKQIGTVSDSNKSIKAGFIYSDIMILDDYIKNKRSRNKNIKKNYGDYVNAEISLDEYDNVTKINYIVYN